MILADFVSCLDVLSRLVFFQGFALFPFFIAATFLFSLFCVGFTDFVVHCIVYESSYSLPRLICYHFTISYCDIHLNDWLFLLRWAWRSRRERGTLCVVYETGCTLSLPDKSYTYLLLASWLVCHWCTYCRKSLQCFSQQQRGGPFPWTGALFDRWSFHTLLIWVHEMVYFLVQCLRWWYCATKWWGVCLTGLYGLPAAVCPYQCTMFWILSFFDGHRPTYWMRICLVRRCTGRVVMAFLRCSLFSQTEPDTKACWKRFFQHSSSPEIPCLSMLR